jgi:dienelactone hydrolase
VVAMNGHPDAYAAWCHILPNSGMNIVAVLGFCSGSVFAVDMAARVGWHPGRAEKAYRSLIRTGTHLTGADSTVAP